MNDTLTDARADGVFVGEVALDEYFRAPRWPDLRDKVYVEALPPQTGGTMANAACCFAAYGPRTELVSMLNEGDASARLRRQLAESGVGTTYLGVDDSLADARTLIFLVDGEHTIFIPDLDYRIDVSDELLTALRTARFVYTTGLEARRLRQRGQASTPQDVLRLVKDGGAQLVLDLDVGSEDDEYLECADIVFVNDVGFAAYCAGRDPAVVVEHILGLGVAILVITRGPNGCSVHGPSATVSVPGVRVDVVDVTGAGDTFGASFLYGLMCTSDLGLAARFANAAAARATTRFGPRGGVAAAGEVLDFMAEHDLFGADDFSCFRTWGR